MQSDDPFTLPHLLYGRKITSLPCPDKEDELEDPKYGDDSALRRRRDLQAAVLQRFWSRWRHEYLASIRVIDRSSGDNEQTIKEGQL